jgi:hypothetical protein
MYHPEMKQRFISERTANPNTQTAAYNLFAATEPYETKLGVDVCAMATEELQSMLDDILGVRTKSKYMRIIMLREYVAWCARNKYPGVSDGIARVSVLGLSKVKKQMVSSPLHLQQYFNAVFDPESEETLDVTYRCYLWLAYGGLKEDAALSIRTGDVHLDTLTVECGANEVPIYREAVAAFRHAATLTDFAAKHPNLTKPSRRDRVPGDMIMRGIRGSAQLLTLRSTLSSKFVEATEAGRTALQLSYYRIWLSGLFYRAYELERSGSTVDFSDTAAEAMRDKTYSDNGNALVLRHKQNRKAKEFMEDYLRWKLAFFV